MGSHLLIAKNSRIYKDVLSKIIIQCSFQPDDVIQHAVLSIILVQAMHLLLHICNLLARGAQVLRCFYSNHRGQQLCLVVTSSCRPTMALFCAFCGSKMLSWKILGIKETALNTDLKSHLTPLVFDVDMKPLEKHADVHGAMNGIDLLKDVGMKRTQAQ